MSEIPILMCARVENGKLLLPDNLTMNEVDAVSAPDRKADHDG